MTTNACYCVSLRQMLWPLPFSQHQVMWLGVYVPSDCFEAVCAAPDHPIAEIVEATTACARTCVLLPARLYQMHSFDAEATFCNAF